MKKMKLAILTMLIAVLSVHQSNAQCPTPSGLAASTMGANSSSLSWQPIAGVTSYLVNVENGRNNLTPFLVTGTTVNPAFVVNGLTGGFVYKFKVRSNCGGNHSSWSPWFTFVAGGGAINCNLLTGLTISNIMSTGATFSWNASAGGLGYRVKVEDGSGNPVNFSFVANTLNNSYSITGLNPSSNYKVKIRKVCAIGVTGPWSAWEPFTTAALRLGQGTELTENSLINMSPNPASDFVELNVVGGSDVKIELVQLYDVTGKLVVNQSVSEDNNSKFPIQDLHNGVYIVKIQTNNSIISKRLIVSK